MFVNNASGKRGLVCQYDVICFDEVSGIKFDQKDGVNIMKGYMESGEFSRGKESIRADGGIVLVGNFDVDVEHQMRIGHLFGPLPPEMRDDTAFMDRIHAFLPGWDVRKVNKSMLTNHFGLVSDFLSECWSQLRRESRVSALQNRVMYRPALSGRDTNAVNKTVSGLLKLLYPLPFSEVPDDELRWAVEIGLECRRRVKEQQKFIGKDEYGDTDFSYEMVQSGDVYWVPTTEREAKLLEPVPSESIGQPDDLSIPKRATALKDEDDAVLGTFGGYTLIRAIGGGGMSEAFVAREESTGHEFFLKRVRVQSADKAALERESRIYEKLTRLRAEHIADVIDFIRGDDYL